MQKSEVMSRYGHEKFEWVMSKAPNLIENEDGTTRDYGPYNGWQTWDGELMTDKETGEYTMVYVPYWGNDTEEGIAGEMFTKFYRAILADGTKANYGGYITNLQFEDLFDDVVEYREKVETNEQGEEVITNEEVVVNKKVGEVLVSFDFDEETYNTFIDSLPTRVPQVVKSLCMASDENAVAKINSGTIPNSAQATHTALDGEIITEPVAFEYNEENREALSRAVLQVTNGAVTTNIKFNNNLMPVKVNRELALRLYLELESFALEVESKNIAYKAMVMAHKNDEKNQASVIESTYSNPNMELEPKYQTMYEELLEDGENNLKAMANNWGIMK